VAVDLTQDGVGRDGGEGRGYGEHGIPSMSALLLSLQSSADVDLIRTGGGGIEYEGGGMGGLMKYFPCRIPEPKPISEGFSQLWCSQLNPFSHPKAGISST
jgi:hypothetical protein